MPPAARALGAFAEAHPQLGLWATGISPASLARRLQKLYKLQGPTALGSSVCDRPSQPKVNDIGAFSATTITKFCYCSSAQPLVYIE